MLDTIGHVRLVDFGLCKQQVVTTVSARTFVGTRGYVAPEVIRMTLNTKPKSRYGRQQGYGNACDWWSLGIVLYEMLTGETPFYNPNPQMMFYKIMNEEPRFTAEIPTDARSLIKGLLQKDPHSRLGSGDIIPRAIMSNSYFNCYDWQKLQKLEITPPWTPSLDGTATDLRWIANFGKPLRLIPQAQ